MQLILVRHGQAVSAQTAGGDSFRWLTDEGRAGVENSARLMPEHTLTTIVSSPLVRAVQTAERLASSCGYTR
ncbi:MAG: SixA phosphatase family protein, partial [Nannocystaceae bacterium]